MARDATYRIDVAVRRRDVLGEGPLYLTEKNSFCWVDIGSNKWCQLDLSSGDVRETQFESALTGFAASSDNTFVGAFADGIAGFGQDGTRGPWLHQPEAHLPDNRFNDAGVDPSGRFIAGTMNMTGSAANGALYALETTGELRQIRGGVGIANTIVFSRDSDLFYTADTSTGTLAAYHYDPETGTMGEQFTGFATPEDLPGAPDGSALDCEGFLWNARWGGSCLVRLAPDGSLDQKIDLPVSNPTSCAFVGDNLFVTTSTWDFTAEDLEREPLAGSVLRIELGLEGAPIGRFGGLDG